MFIVHDHGLLDWDNLINDADPLNTGLISEWVVGDDNPYWGGPKLWDVCGQNHGTLANGPTWQGPLGRPNGFGSLFFDGTNDLLTTGYTPPGLPLTIACWANSGSADNYSMIFGSGRDGAAINVGFTILFSTDSVGAHAYADAQGVTGRIFAGYAVAGGATGGWNRLLATCDGSTVNIYVNGLLKSTASGTTGTITFGEALKVGPRGAAGAGSDWSGYWDGGCAWNRILSASEAWRDFQESSAGNPSRWNWNRRPQYVEVAGAATAFPWHYYQQMMAG